MEYVFLTWLRVASSERIASVSVHAVTNRTVIVNSTFGILTASVGAGIDTLLIRTSLIVTTFGANNAFGPTTRWTTDIGWQTRADSLVVHFAAL